MIVSQKHLEIGWESAKHGAFADYWHDRMAPYWVVAWPDSVKNRRFDETARFLPYETLAKAEEDHPSAHVHSDLAHNKLSGSRLAANRW
jgi:hypothetical protein